MCHVAALMSPASAEQTAVLVHEWVSPILAASPSVRAGRTVAWYRSSEAQSMHSKITLAGSEYTGVQYDGYTPSGSGLACTHKQVVPGAPLSRPLAQAFSAYSTVR